MDGWMDFSWASITLASEHRLGQNVLTKSIHHVVSWQNFFPGHIGIKALSIFTANIQISNQRFIKYTFFG
jgi:hypothetical protein